ncbi:MULTISPECIES: glycerophosphodiester phosphodiesterase family protein [Cytobacillus]|uniref:Glycerophosphodiester phosphodiesterase n=1 Tax=Cytobacillus oceanisediminis 2691 TaxID=1196031 RepID=A0A169FEI5_9BACI|nr:MULTISPECIES: glycerophosphodiester phosphodiesterase family protein [Cytobacillus]MBY0156746.1 glycerophosphodiester phosphodiesterase [Cytobacillus firmus]AND38181.1 glycerophosphodiester phosphodiesterase [Cytobacillus oceanisediminis 2691]MBU8731136.1 glycerophosphodiester phosphodiesterase [Cytobacillus oceanisediminis]MCM3245189.1 glycerophosphodiester phosphodiesterase [Cytobacillus oceanisediminis]MCM3391371.1 glycerophosphodiester phosphodiesterase [Cytobacillus oceanisediminis]
MNKKLLIGTGVALSLLFSPISQAFAAEPTTGERKQVDNIAHRGATGYAPENTVAGFDLAVDMKADYIEIDVQRSKDGELVVIHDTSVDRTTDGTGKVGDLTFDYLRSLDAGSWKGEQFAGEPIPTFEEILDRYHGKVGILIELKAPELYPGIEEQVADKIKERNLDKPQNEKIIIQSFNFESMKTMDQLLPNVPIGVLTSNRADTTAEALQEFSAYADWFNPSYGIVTKELVNQVHSLGMQIGSWTVRSQDAADFLFEMDVDAIITDYPDYVDPRN